MYNTMNNPSAHPSYSHYYLLSPSTLFFVFFFCTSYCFFAHLVVFLHISLSFAHLIVFCTSYCFLHILLFCTFLFHCTFYSYFSFSYHMYALVLCYLYNLYSYCFALSTERTWFDCISLLVMPCITIMWQIKKPWTLNLDLALEYIYICNSMISFLKTICIVNDYRCSPFLQPKSITLQNRVFIFRILQLKFTPLNHY